MGLLGDLKNKVLDNFTSATFDIDVSMKVRDLQESFHRKFGASLRVYIGNSWKPAPSDSTIKDIMPKGRKDKPDGIKFSIKGVDKAGEVEEQFKKHYGINVQIANRMNTKLADNNKTLGEIARSE